MKGLIQDMKKSLLICTQSFLGISHFDIAISGPQEIIYSDLCEDKHLYIYIGTFCGIKSCLKEKFSWPNTHNSFFVNMPQNHNPSMSDRAMMEMNKKVDIILAQLRPSTKKRTLLFCKRHQTSLLKKWIISIVLIPLTLRD